MCVEFVEGRLQDDEVCNPQCGGAQTVQDGELVLLPDLYLEIAVVVFDDLALDFFYRRPSSLGGHANAGWQPCKLAKIIEGAVGDLVATVDDDDAIGTSSSSVSACDESRIVVPLARKASMSS